MELALGGLAEEVQAQRKMHPHQLRPRPLPQKWGCLTKKDNRLYVHILQQNAGAIRLEQFPYKTIVKAWRLKDKTPVNVSLRDGIAEIPAQSPTPYDPDQVVVLELGK